MTGDDIYELMIQKKGLASPPKVNTATRLTDSDIASLRAQSRRSALYAKRQLAIDPALKQLGPPGGHPKT
ncbi:hypothetical protein [Rhodanobacter sp. BL-MT-08]